MSVTWIAMGLGTDSIAMAVEMTNRGEKIDLVTFADTAAERQRTYAMLPLVDAWLRARGQPGVTVVKYAPKTSRGRQETLEDSIVRNRTVPALAFGFHTCSVRFKIQPQLDYAETFQPFVDAWARGEKVSRCIGYDNGKRDRKRSAGSATFAEDDRYSNRYPLQEFGLDRDRCREIILAAGLPDPGKSSCYFCPAMSVEEIQELGRVEPDKLARALAIEEQALSSGKLKKTKGLNRKFAWRDVV